MQTVIMIIGAFVLMAIGFNETGGYDNMIESYFNATAANRNYVQWIFPTVEIPTYFGMDQIQGKNRHRIRTKQWKNEQVSRCCTADVYLRQCLNEQYNNQKMAKLVFFSTACS